MTTETALQKYMNAVDKRDAHIADNKEVFKAHENIVMEIIDAENELRDAVAESGVGLDNGVIKVTVTPQTQRVYDEDKMKKVLSPTQFADIVSDVTRPSRITISKIRD